MPHRSPPGECVYPQAIKNIEQVSPRVSESGQLARLQIPRVSPPARVQLLAFAYKLKLPKTLIEQTARAHCHIRIHANCVLRDDMMIPFDSHYRIDKNKIRTTQVMGDQEFTGGGGGQVFFHPRTGGARTLCLDRGLHF